jgi:hypothetical protein
MTAEFVAKAVMVTLGPRNKSEDDRWVWCAGRTFYALFFAFAFIVSFNRSFRKWPV